MMNGGGGIYYGIYERKEGRKEGTNETGEVR